MRRICRGRAPMSDTALSSAPWTCPPTIICQECCAELEHPQAHPDEAPNEGDTFACVCGAVLRLDAYDCDDDRGGVWQWVTA